MNNFQSTESGEAILKDNYAAEADSPRSALGEALRRRRRKLLETRLGEGPEALENEPAILGLTDQED